MGGRGGFDHGSWNLHIIKSCNEPKWLRKALLLPYRVCLEDPT